MDNLRGHKTSEVIKNYHEENVEVLFLPPFTPEYIAIESLFALLKSKLKDFKFNTKQSLS